MLLDVDPAQLLRLAFRSKVSQLGFRASANYRFDAPAGEFGVLYAAFDLATAFAETVLRSVPQEIPAGEEPLLTYEELARRRVVQLAAMPGSMPLRLVKLYDEGLAAAKVDNRIATDDEYATTRLWSKAFHDHPEKADGIAYLSRFMGARRSVRAVRPLRWFAQSRSGDAAPEACGFPGRRARFQAGDQPAAEAAPVSLDCRFRVSISCE